MQSVVFLSIIAFIVLFCIYALVNKKKSKNTMTESTSFPRTEKDWDIFLRQNEIEHKAHPIRMVVVSYISSILNPYPYDIKKNIEIIKEYHPKVLSLFNTDMYHECVAYEYEDMFVDKDFSLTKYESPEDLEKYKAFYQSYTENPKTLDLQKLKSYIREEYLSGMDQHLFEL